nr:hypothetical protein [Tanacetum cinerariifolium]
MALPVQLVNNSILARKKLTYLEQPIPPIPTYVPPATEVPTDVIALYNRCVDTQQKIACLMLAYMTPDLQKNLEDLNANDMLKELKNMFSHQSEHKLLKIVKAFHACLVAETFDCDEEEVSDDEEITQVKVLMALADGELVVGKNHVRNGKWIDITMRKRHVETIGGEVVYQRLRNTLTHVLELSSCIYLGDRAWGVLNFDSAGVRDNA